MPSVPSKIKKQSPSTPAESAQSSSSQPTKKYRFMLKTGVHQGDNNVVYNAGDIIETDNDLRKHNSPGFPRFVLVDVGPGGESSSSEMDPSSDGLENLKLEELVQYAKEGDVDIFGVESDKAEIINRIRNADKESLA